MPLFPKSLSASAKVAVVLLSMLHMTGCADDGPRRIALWGRVTWKGQPVPRGVVYFGPDVKKGNTGPQGYALIEDGVFDTRQSTAKGCVAGPHIVQIDGCDGKNIRNGYPYGNPLFALYETSVEVSPEGGEIDLVVPATAKAASPVAYEPE